MRNFRACLLALAVVLLAVVEVAGSGSAAPNEMMEISLADVDVKMVGEEDGDWAGYSASPVGDINGDGYADVLIGAPLAGFKSGTPTPKGEGRAYLILGKPRSEWSPEPINLASADAIFRGCRRASMTARQVYAAGDVNGDGLDDFLISGWKCDDGVLFQGKAYLFLGRSNVNWGDHFPVELANASFLGEALRDHASYYVSTAGDVNGDGYDDFLITSTHNNESGQDAGQVYLILGRAEANWGANYPLAQSDASFLGESPGDRAGRSATGVGDVNGDGYDDVLIGSLSNAESGVDAGQSYLILGRPEADWGTDYPLSQADASFLGEAAGDESGRRVAGAGDVNGDGYADMLIGASRNSQAGEESGKSYLILGRPEADWGMDFSLALADAAFLGEAEFDQSGRRVSSAGDVNDDGLDDFLVGAPHNARAGEGAGAAYLLYGRLDAGWGTSYPLSQADTVYVGEAAFDSAGYDVAPAGDVDGDGVNDILIGAFGGREELAIPGQSYLVLSSNGPTPVGFTPDSPDGHVDEWHSYVCDYADPNGWDDVAVAQMALGRSPNDLKALNVKYETVRNAFYLRDRSGANWIGPCTPGEQTELDNGLVQLDCSISSVVNDGDRMLQITWVGRWVRPLNNPMQFGAFLRAKDMAGNDSGFEQLGTWTLLP